METVRCIVCGREIQIKDDPMTVRPAWYWKTCACPECRHNYPPSLIKACGDSFRYTLKLRNSEAKVDFSRARINGSWVTVMCAGNDDLIKLDGVICPRGADININDIEWVADDT